MGVPEIEGTAEFVVTDEVVRDYESALGHGAPTAGSPPPPTLASVFTYAAVAAMPVKDGVVLTGQELDFHRPLALGERLTTRYRVVDEYERRQRSFMVIRTETRNEREELVVVGHITRMLPATATSRS